VITHNKIFEYSRWKEDNGDSGVGGGYVMLKIWLFTKEIVLKDPLF
jgi:hypothetical protein